MSSVDLILDEDSNLNEQFIGKIVGIDEDLPPFNQIFYYLLPQCKKFIKILNFKNLGSNQNNEFKIGLYSGEIYKNQGFVDWHKHNGKIRLCAFIRLIKLKN